MLPPFGNRRDRSAHDQAIREEIAETEANPFESVVAADHVDDYRDPDLINGRRPDLVVENTLTDERTAIEKETHPGSSHSQQQIKDLREGTERRGWGFDLDLL